MGVALEQAHSFLGEATDQHSIVVGGPAPGPHNLAPNPPSRGEQWGRVE